MLLAAFKDIEKVFRLPMHKNLLSEDFLSSYSMIVSTTNSLQKNFPSRIVITFVTNNEVKVCIKPKNGRATNHLP